MLVLFAITPTKMEHKQRRHVRCSPQSSLSLCLFFFISLLLYPFLLFCYSMFSHLSLFTSYVHVPFLWTFLPFHVSFIFFVCFPSYFYFIFFSFPFFSLCHISSSPLLNFWFSPLFPPLAPLLLSIFCFILSFFLTSHFLPSFAARLLYLFFSFLPSLCLLFIFILLLFFFLFHFISALHLYFHLDFPVFLCSFYVSSCLCFNLHSFPPLFSLVPPSSWFGLVSSPFTSSPPLLLFPLPFIPTCLVLLSCVCLGQKER